MDFESTSLKCPRCGAAAAALVPRVRIYLIAEVSDGPIVGIYGKRFACVSDPAKKTFIQHQEAFTDDPLAVTNPACKETDVYKKLKRERDLQHALATGNLTGLDENCCE